eukprot:scaffold23187_cov32-Tisochrysis_lutea.AAC.1
MLPSTFLVRRAHVHLRNLGNILAVGPQVPPLSLSSPPLFSFLIPLPHPQWNKSTPPGDRFREGLWVRDRLIKRGHMKN